jgi:hypothetical protein
VSVLLRQAHGFDRERQTVRETERGKREGPGGTGAFVLPTTAHPDGHLVGPGQRLAVIPVGRDLGPAARPQGILL